MGRDFGPERVLSEEELVPNESVKAALTAPGNLSAFEIEEKVVDGKLIKTWKNLRPSMRAFWDFASQYYSDRQYLISEGEILKYSDVHLQSLRIANWLRLHHQVRKGDRVAIVARNIPEYVSSYWAVQMLGAVAVLVNAFSEPEILAFCIADVDCRVVICDVERYERIQPYIPSLRPAGSVTGKASLKIPGIDTSSFAPRREGVHGFVVIPRKGRAKLAKNSRPWSSGNLGSHLSCFEELNERYGLPSEAHTIASPTGSSIGKNDLSMIVGPESEILPEDLCQILFTSGTTSTPKGVISTQRQCISCLSLAGYGGARALVARRAVLPPPPSPGLDEDQLCTLVLVPLFHTTGLQSALIAATSGGGRVIMMNKWDLKEACNLIKKHEAQVIVGIGFMVRSILKSGENMPSLRMVSHGGAAAAKEIPSEATKLRSGMLVGVGYGLTEVNGVAAALAGDMYHHNPTAVGYPPPAVDLKIVDPETLITCNEGDVGELWIRGPGVAKGYWNRPKATAEAFLPDGWFRSGDLGRIEKGLLYIVDRAKDIIIRGGENISCSAVENAVYNEKRILDCAAVSLPDPVLGEKVAVVCIPKDSTSIPSEAEIIFEASKSLPKHAVPEFVWVRTQPLERNANGKVLKTVLRKEVAAYAEEKEVKLSSKL